MGIQVRYCPSSLYIHHLENVFIIHNEPADINNISLCPYIISIIQRNSVFKWLAAMGLELGQTRIKQHLPTMLRPLVREYTDSSGNEGKKDHFMMCYQMLRLLRKTAQV